MAWLFGSSASRSSRAASSASRRSLDRDARELSRPARTAPSRRGRRARKRQRRARVVPSPPRSVTATSRALRRRRRGSTGTSPRSTRSARCASRRCATRPPRFSFRQKRGRRRGGRARIITTSAARVRCARARCGGARCAARRSTTRSPSPTRGTTRGAGSRRSTRTATGSSRLRRCSRRSRRTSRATGDASSATSCRVHSHSRGNCVSPVGTRLTRPPRRARKRAGCSPRGTPTATGSSSCARWSRPVACWSTSRARSRVPGRGKNERRRTKARRGAAKARKKIKEFDAGHETGTKPSGENVRVRGERPGRTFGATSRRDPPALARHPDAWFAHWDEDGSGTLDKQEVTRALVKTLLSSESEASRTRARARRARDRRRTPSDVDVDVYEGASYGRLLTAVAAAREARRVVDAIWPVFCADGSAGVDRAAFLAPDGLAEAIVANTRVGLGPGRARAETRGDGALENASPRRARLDAVRDSNIPIFPLPRVRRRLRRGREASVKRVTFKPYVSITRTVVPSRVIIKIRRVNEMTEYRALEGSSVVAGRRARRVFAPAKETPRKKENVFPLSLALERLVRGERVSLSRVHLRHELRRLHAIRSLAHLHGGRAEQRRLGRRRG